jgi:uncharacterized membrane protein
MERLSQLPEDQQLERSVLAGHVIAGTNGWDFVNDALNGGERKPKNLANALKSVRDANAARDAAQAELKDAKDPKVKDSLAQQLEKAKAATAPATNTVDKKAVQAALTKVRVELEKVTGPVKSKATNIAETKKALDDAEVLVK